MSAPRAASRERVYLFDLDGTLIDSIELIRRSYEHTLVAHGRRAPTREEWLEGLGIPLRDQFARHSDDAGEVQEMIATYRAWNLLHHDEMVCAYPGVHEGLDALSALGARLGVVTSKQLASARRGLAYCGLTDRFELLIGSDDVRSGKPDPEPVLLALERMGARAEDAVYVGDSTHDLAAGRAAGTLTAAVTWGPLTREQLAAYEPDAWVERPSELGRLAELFAPA